MLCYNVGQYSPDLHMFGSSIPVVKTEQHLGCHVGTDSNPKRIDRLIGDIYYNCNALLTNFGMLNSDIKYSLFKTFCMPLYSSTLIVYDDKNITRLHVAWKKAIRKLLNLHQCIHSRFVNAIGKDDPFEVQLHKIVIRFTKLCVKNKLSNLALSMAIEGSGSFSCNSLNVTCNTFNLDKLSLLSGEINVNRLSHNAIIDDQDLLICDTIASFMMYRDSLCKGSVDYVNVSYILELLCTQ